MRSSWGVSQSVGVGVGVGVGALVGWWAWRRRYVYPELPTKWEEAGEVSRLVIYPLKSGGGISVDQAEATPYGLASQHARDRSLLVVTEEGKFVTGRQAPRLPTITLTFSGISLTLAAPEPSPAPLTLNLTQVVTAGQVKPAVVFNANVRGYDCGQEAATWVTEVLHGQEGAPLRLLYSADLTTNRSARRQPYYDFKQFNDADKVVYADTCAFMLASETSLGDLNARLSSPVTMDWFRSNIIVNGAPPYDEDDWAFVKMGDVVLRRIKPCDRCIFTTVDPVKGTKTPDQEPITTLKKYRLTKEPEAVARAWASKPVFGSHLGINTCGTVKVGDKVMVARASTNPKWRI